MVGIVEDVAPRVAKKQSLQLKESRIWVSCFDNLTRLDSNLSRITLITGYYKNSEHKLLIS